MNETTPVENNNIIRRFKQNPTTVEGGNGGEQEALVPVFFQVME